MKVAVIIPAAGLGTRMSPVPVGAKPAKAPPSKQFTELAGTPILIHTLHKFAASSAVNEIWIALRENEIAGFRARLEKEAEKQIKNPVIELTNLANEQLLGGLDVFEKDFGDSLKKSDIPKSEQTKMIDKAHLSAETIKSFAAWLKALKNDHPRSFRLGKDLYEDKFKYEIQTDT